MGCKCYMYMYVCIHTYTIIVNYKTINLYNFTLKTTLNFLYLVSLIIWNHAMLLLIIIYLIFCQQGSIWLFGHHRKWTSLLGYSILKLIFWTLFFDISSFKYHKKISSNSPFIQCNVLIGAFIYVNFTIKSFKCV